MPTLQLTDVATGYSLARKETVLHANMNWVANTGELVLLAGRNGSGKTTLLRTLCGLQNPLHGTVSVRGESLHPLPPSGRAALVSLLMSSAPNLPLTRAVEVVLTGRHRFLNPWMPAEKEHLEHCVECMEIVGVAHLQDREFSRLSDGEKQKVMLARCLAQDTPVLLLDEPLAFLDYPSRRELLQLLRELCTNSGKCILYSSHDLELALQFADHLLMLGEPGQWTWTSGADNIRKMSPATLFSEV